MPSGYKRKKAAKKKKNESQRDVDLESNNAGDLQDHSKNDLQDNISDPLPVTILQIDENVVENLGKEDLRVVQVETIEEEEEQSNGGFQIDLDEEDDSVKADIRTRSTQSDFKNEDESNKEIVSEEHYPYGIKNTQSEDVEYDPKQDIISHDDSVKIQKQVYSAITQDSVDFNEKEQDTSNPEETRERRANVIDKKVDDSTTQSKEFVTDDRLLHSNHTLITSSDYSAEQHGNFCPNEAFVIGTPRTTSWKSCCGLFEVFKRSGW